MIDRKIEPDISEIDTIKYLLPEQWELSNGIKVWGINGGSQELVKIDFIFDAGTWYQPANLIAGLTNAFLNQGTEKYSAQKIAEIFDYRGAYLNLNADQQFGSVTILTLNKYLEEILEVTSDVIRNPAFPQKEVKTQIAKKRQQFIIENNKVKVLGQKRFSQVLFGDKHAYSNTNTLSDYEGLTRDRFVDFHRKHYNANHCKIIVAGLYSDELKAKLDHHFGQKEWLSNNIAENRIHLIEPDKDREHVIPKADALQSAIRIGRIFPNRNESDFFGLNVLVTLLGGYFGSRLMSNVREEKGYTYGIGAGIFSLTNAAFLSISTEVGVDVCSPALNEIYYEIERLQNELVEPDELNAVRNFLLGETLRSFDGVFAMSNSLRTLIEADLYYSHYDSFIDTIRTITPDELQLLARKYFNKTDMYEVVAGKLEL